MQKEPSRLTDSAYNFQIIWSDGFTSKEWSQDTITEEIISENEGIQQVKASSPINDMVRRFFRLRISPK